MASDSVRTGLVDRIGTLDDVLQSYGIDRGRAAPQDSTSLAMRRLQLQHTAEGGSMPNDNDDDREQCLQGLSRL